MEDILGGRGHSWREGTVHVEDGGSCESVHRVLFAGRVVVTQMEGVPFQIRRDSTQEHGRRPWHLLKFVGNPKISVQRVVCGGFVSVQRVVCGGLRLKFLSGFVSVQRVVCGGCHDFKVIINLNAPDIGVWESAKFEPEEEFLGKLKAIPGVSTVETQTFTLVTI